MENKQQQHSMQLAPNVHILLHGEFSAMDCTQNSVSKCRFFLYI